MELELNMTHLNCYDTVLNTTVFQEETLESIVPDACPDILRIVDAEAMVCLKGKEAQEGRAEVTGTVRVSILYLPEGANGVRRMTVSLPFTCNAENPSLHSGCKLVVVPRVQSADSRSLNPRKVLTRVSLAIDLQVYAPQTSAICDGVCGGEENGIQQLSETQNAYLAVAVEEKPFTFSDDVSLSGSKPKAEELLKSKVDLVCNESKLIGNKLIFKGEAKLQILYRDPSGMVCNANYELPFSQIMEVSGVQEEADCTLQVQLTGCDCILSGDEDDGHTLSVNLAMLAQAVVREERQVQLLSDVYSTACDLTADRKPYTFYRLVERGSRRVTVREIVETVSPVKSVCDVYVTVGSISQSREGPRLTIRAESSVTVVYLGEDDSLSTITRPLPATCQLDLADCLISCRCACDGEHFATPAGGGVEVRYALDFHYLAQTPQNTLGVDRVHLDETKPRNAASQPSIILRMVGEHERLWDIAKAYGTTRSDIVHANALDSEELLPVGQLLLIPKKR